MKCAVGPCNAERIEGNAFCGKHGPKTDLPPSRNKKVKRSASSLHGVCPKCGGTQFEAVRSTKRKVAFGLASLLAPANEVRCIMCKERFARG